MFFRDVIDQLHNGDGFANPCTAEKANLATLRDGHNEVNDFNARFKRIDRGRLISVTRGLAMNWQLMFGANGACFIHGVTQHIENPTKRRFPDWNRNRRAGAAHRETTFEPVTRTHRDASHNAVTQLLLHFER